MAIAKKILLFFILWRVFLYVPLLVSEIFLQIRSGYEYTLLAHFLEKDSILFNPFLYPFGSFDGVHYLLVSSEGYTANAGFFPLLPLTISFVLFFAKNYSTYDSMHYFFAIGLVTAYFFFALFYFYKLIRLDYKENIAILSIFFLLIFPTSFFYAAIYSEGLFLLLSLMCFYFARQKKWFVAGVVGSLLSATRLIGIFMFPAVLYEYIKHEKNKSILKLFSICLIPGGLIAYAIFNFYKWGNPIHFIESQGNFANNRTVDSVVLFPQTVFRYIKILFSLDPKIYEWWLALFELSIFFFASLLFYVAWKKKVRFSYLLFSALCFLLPVSSGTFSGLPRYIVVLFPLFIAMALIKNKYFKIIYSAVSITLLFILFMLFSKGYYVA